MPDKPVLPTTAHALLRHVARVQADGRVPALVAGVVRDGELVWSGGRGRIGGPDPRTPGPRTPGTRTPGPRTPDTKVQFRIGSITKTFTAVLVARLRDEGRLDFSDPLDRHLPGTPLGDRTITQLLSHTSGVQAETDGPWWERTAGTSWEELSKTFGEELVRHPAGYRFHYSNLGYAALGELVARQRGTSWYAALRTEVLDPLAMRRTTYLPEAPHAEGFAVHPWADVVLPEPAHDAGAMAPAGQLWSTIGDLARWVAFLGRTSEAADVLAPDTLAELAEVRAISDEPGWASGYALGLQVLDAGERRLVGHGGSMPGFLAALFFSEADGLGGVVLANTTSGIAPGSLCADLVSTVAELEPRLPAEWRPASRLPEGVSDLVGVWYWGPTPFGLRACGEGGDLKLGPLTGRGRNSRFRRAGRDVWVGLDGYYAGETLRAVRRPEAPNGTVTWLDLASFVFTREPYDADAPIPGGVDPGGWAPH